MRGLDDWLWRGAEWEQSGKLVKPAIVNVYESLGLKGHSAFSELGTIIFLTLLDPDLYNHK